MLLRKKTLRTEKKIWYSPPAGSKIKHTKFRYFIVQHFRLKTVTGRLSQVNDGRSRNMTRHDHTSARIGRSLEHMHGRRNSYRFFFVFCCFAETIILLMIRFHRMFLSAHIFLRLLIHMSQMGGRMVNDLHSSMKVFHPSRIINRVHIILSFYCLN